MDRGMIVNLNDGLQVEIHSIPTRLIAWPGNGFIHTALHLLTLNPGTTTPLYTYQISEEALLCLHGSGQVFLHNQWVTIQPGDIPYIPENIPHAISNPTTNTEPLILVAAIAIPPLDLYETSNLYDRQTATFNTNKIQELQNNNTDYSRPLEHPCSLTYHDTHHELRPWNLTNTTIRSQGALFNITKGALSSAIGSPLFYILWPGYGTRNLAFHFAYAPSSAHFITHKHPLSDDLIITFNGSMLSVLDNKECSTRPYDCVMAPCGILHGGKPKPNLEHKTSSNTPEPIMLGGFSAPPQLDLYLRSGHYARGIFSRPPFVNTF
ncbi:MAG TPA: cupin domain-containing protein [Candidatus Babeliaceae bacterium]|nr:cupin domain-containing protein [Candidatus Babeliaceae bacterium]